MKKETLESRIETLEYFNRGHTHENIAWWIFTSIILTIILFGILLNTIPKSQEVINDFQDDPEDFCKHYNMTYQGDVFEGYSCIETKDGYIINKKKLTIVNNKYYFGNER